MANSSTSQATRLRPTERQLLLERFESRLETAPHLTRKLVSFQSNKTEPIYRWVKYKEGFSAELVRYFLSEYFQRPGRLLDPFAGSGTALFAGRELGWEAHGIELLPVGVFIAEARKSIGNIEPQVMGKLLESLPAELDALKNVKPQFEHIAITRFAFSDETENELNRFLAYCESVKSADLRTILRLAAFAVLEDISFTRKDGQYLRWDSRSDRNLLRTTFHKGPIIPFHEAIFGKLQQILKDLPFVPSSSNRSKPRDPLRNVNLLEGSCLKILPGLPNDYFDCVLTSPPYCNRYDYTRTYALELVFLGLDNEEIKNLRQTLLSCTVENKDKVAQLKVIYDTIERVGRFDTVMNAYHKSGAMMEVNDTLDKLNIEGRLNNSNIPRMVRNYFLELCFVIFELARVIRIGGYCIMVNDNVRYGGEEVPVDLILSEFAEKFGFVAEKILVLPRGKGNSSQQMGIYGRSEIRKCVYVWRKV